MAVADGDEYEFSLDTWVALLAGSNAWAGYWLALMISTVIGARSARLRRRMVRIPAATRRSTPSPS